MQVSDHCYMPLDGSVNTLFTPRHTYGILNTHDTRALDSSKQYLTCFLASM